MIDNCCRRNLLQGFSQSLRAPHAALVLGAVLVLSPADNLAQEAADRPAPKIAVRAVVHPGMELITIMLWLAGRYPPPVDSLYKSAVWSHFREHRDHPSLATVRAPKSMYPDFTETGWLLAGGPDEWRVELPEKCSWYAVIGKAETAAILRAAPRFAADTDFAAFYRAQAERFGRWQSEMEGMLAEHEALDRLDRFFRFGSDRQRPQVTVCLEPLNGWGAHAILFDSLKGEPNGRRVTFQIGSSGAATFPDSELQFRSARSMLGTVWHEGSHVYLNPAMRTHAARIDEMKRLFNSHRLRSQNVTTWSYCLEENIVRACVVAMMHQERGREAADREMRTQVQRGFLYVPLLARCIIDEYVPGAERYTDFDAFVPRLLAALDELRNPGEAPPPPPGK
ncbi:MAG: DUF4932 domain-containing protein [bacterium]|nr:DUF4932 domain-containing protein [bacterium]